MNPSLFLMTLLAFIQYVLNQPAFFCNFGYKDGNKCVTNCPTGKEVVGNRCLCPIGQTDNGSGCVSTNCSNYDPEFRTCVITCDGAKILDRASNTCFCPKVMKNFNCQESCGNDYVEETSKACIPKPQPLCAPGLKYDIVKKNCVSTCPLDLMESKYDSNMCTCAGGRAYFSNSTVTICTNTTLCATSSGLQIGCNCDPGMLKAQNNTCIPINSCTGTIDENLCLPPGTCQENKIFNKEKKICECKPYFIRDLNSGQCFIFGDFLKFPNSLKPDCLNKGMFLKMDPEGRFKCEKCPDGFDKDDFFSCKSCDVANDVCKWIGNNFIRYSCGDSMKPAYNTCVNKCGEGKYYDKSINDCSNCDANQYTSFGQCISCNVGEEFKTSPNFPSYCRPCINGKYRSESMAGCEICKMHYILNPEKSSCKPCQEGYQGITNKCVACDPGYVSNSINDFQCLPS